MGGIGASENAGGAPRIKNPAGIPSNAMTEEEFLRLKGVGDLMSGYTVDKMRGNRQIKTQRGKERFEKEVKTAEESYQQKRQQAKAEYKKLIESGKIRDKTSIEKRITTAHGHPDNSSTQAARRLLEKQGIDWRTGKKKKK